MTNNPLLDGAGRGKRHGQKLSPEEWADRGNDILADIGRRDVHWFVHDGKLCIGWKPGRPPAGAPR